MVHSGWSQWGRPLLTLLVLMVVACGRSHRSTGGIGGTAGNGGENFLGGAPPGGGPSTGGSTSPLAGGGGLESAEAGTAGASPDTTGGGGDSGVSGALVSGGAGTPIGGDSGVSGALVSGGAGAPIGGGAGVAGALVSGSAGLPLAAVGGGQSAGAGGDNGADGTLLAPTQSASLYGSTRFLYTGTSAPQHDVDPDTIEAKRIGIVRGLIQRRDGTGLEGVDVSVLAHPEFGWTQTAADGSFSLVVNGGGWLTLDYQAAGYLPVARRVYVPWNAYAHAEAAVLTALDSEVTTIDLGALATPAVARGSQQTDSDGSRRATLVFKPGTEATMILPDGGQSPLTSLSVRATEYTVGDSGPLAMPAELPPTSGYTYCVELSADEALARNAEVRFTQPVVFYLENFLDFSVGSAVPVGTYVRTKGVWIGDHDGLVIEVLSAAADLAEVDLDGDGQAEDATTLADWGIDAGERRTLASLYTSGTTLWRVPIPHFSPCDMNWPYGLPADAVAPTLEPVGDLEREDTCEQPGSIIECQNQVLGQRIAVPGLPYSLNYRSDRVPGGSSRNIDIPLVGSEVPPSLAHVDVTVEVAGQQHEMSFAPVADSTHHFRWDGLDAFGRQVQGTVHATVTIGYAFRARYLESNQSFGQSFGLVPPDATVTNDQTRVEIAVSRSFDVPLSILDARGIGVSGWTLDAHHFYDTSKRSVQLGTGGRHFTTGGIGKVLSTETTFDTNLIALAIDRAGDVYFVDHDNPHQIQRRDAEGVIEPVVGLPGASGGHGADGQPALDTQLWSPSAIAFGPTGQLYWSELEKVRTLLPDGTVTTVAGQFHSGSVTADQIGDGGPATEALIAQNIDDLVIDVDGAVYLIDRGNLCAECPAATVRRVGTNGIIERFAGNGTSGYSGDGGPAALASLYAPTELAISADGRLYIKDRNLNRGDIIRRVDVDGTISTWAGNGSVASGGEPLGERGPATEVFLENVRDLTAGPDGTLYFLAFHRLDFTGLGSSYLGMVLPNGIFHVIGGDGEPDPAPADYVPIEGAAALGQRLNVTTLSQIVSSPDGSLYLTEQVGNQGRYALRKLAVTPDIVSLDETVIPAPGGGELYVFNPGGQHLRTLHGISGEVLREFGYDLAGRLILIQEHDGRTTEIEWDARGIPSGLVDPQGRETRLEADANGYLAVVEDIAGRQTTMSYSDDGLLETFARPDAAASSYAYGPESGRLISATDPLGEIQTLEQTVLSDAVEVVHTTRADRERRFWVASDSLRDHTMIVELDGRTNERIREPDGTEYLFNADGTQSVVSHVPDPRLGMSAPLASEYVVETPSGLTSTTTAQRTVVLDDPEDLTRVLSQIDTVEVNGSVYTTQFDAESGTWTTTSPEGRQSTTQVDAYGRVLSHETAGAPPFVVEWNEEGTDVVAIRQGEGSDLRQTTFAHDALGRLTQITLPNSQSLSILEYDAADRPTSVELMGGRTLGFSYDQRDNIVSLTTPNGDSHAFSWTDQDQLERYTPPDAATLGGELTYLYDPDGLLQQMTHSEGDSVTHSYGANGRLLATALDGGEVSFGYHATTGLLETITGPYGETLTYGRDGPLLLQTDWSGVVAGSVRRTYGDGFRRATEGINELAPISFEYDDDGLMTKAGDLSFERDEVSGRVSGTQIGLVADDFAYNEYGELVAHSATVDGAVLFTTQYTRDELGWITRIERQRAGEEAVVETYAMDAAGRLTGEDVNGVSHLSLSYDNNGNRFNNMVKEGESEGTYDAQDRIVTYGSYEYEHDERGYRTETRDTDTGDTTTFVADAVGNLLTVTLPDSTVIDYVIDGKNRRVGRRVDGELVQGFLYRDGLSPVAELDGSGNVVSQFVYGPRPHSPELIVRGAVAYRLFTDHLGSPRFVVNVATGDVVQEMDYDAFGNVIRDTNPGFQPFGFAGGLYDKDTGLVRFGYRDYDPFTGRWTAKDPAGFQGGDANLYAYSFNNPVNLIDPPGLALTDFFKTPGFSNVNVWAIGAIRTALQLKQLDKEVQWSLKNAGELANTVGNGDVHVADALQHCLASCSITRNFGPGTAHFAGDAHEAQGLIMHGQPWTEAIADSWNNQVGRICGLAADDSQECIDNCVGAYQGGWLETEWN